MEQWNPSRFRHSVFRQKGGIFNLRNQASNAESSKFGPRSISNLEQFQDLPIWQFEICDLFSSLDYYGRFLNISFCIFARIVNLHITFHLLHEIHP